MAGSRYPFPLPFGWSTVARVDELDPAAVTRFRAVERDLVVWERRHRLARVRRLLPAPRRPPRRRRPGRGRLPRVSLPRVGLRCGRRQRRHPLRRPPEPQGAGRVVRDAGPEPPRHLLVPPGPGGRAVWRSPTPSPTTPSSACGSPAGSRRSGRSWPRTRSTWPTSSRSTACPRWGRWATSSWTGRGALSAASSRSRPRRVSSRAPSSRRATARASGS